MNRRCHKRTWKINIVSKCFVKIVLVSESKDYSAVDSVTNSELSSVTATLQLILLLEEFRPSSLRQVSVVSRIARLLCLFLTGMYFYTMQYWLML